MFVHLSACFKVNNQEAILTFHRPQSLFHPIRTKPQNRCDLSSDNYCSVFFKRCVVVSYGVTIFINLNFTSLKYFIYPHTLLWEKNEFEHSFAIPHPIRYVEWRSYVRIQPLCGKPVTAASSCLSIPLSLSQHLHLTLRHRLKLFPYLLYLSCFSFLKMLLSSYLHHKDSETLIPLSS